MIKGTCQKIETLSDGSVKFSVYVSVTPLDLQKVDLVALRQRVGEALQRALEIVQGEGDNADNQ